MLIALKKGKGWRRPRNLVVYKNRKAVTSPHWNHQHTRRNLIPFPFFFSSSFLRHSTGLPPFLIAIHQNHAAMTPSPNRRRRNNYGTREAKSRIKADVVVIVALPADYPPPPPHPCSYTAELLYQPVNVDPAYIALVTVPASWNGYRAVSMLIQRLP